MLEENESTQNLSESLSAAYDKIQEAPEVSNELEVAEKSPSQEESVTAETVETETAKAPEKAQEPAKVEAPSSWRAEARAKFSSLDPDIQQEVLKREEDATNGFAKYSEDSKYAQSLREVITPYMPIITAEGGTPATAVQELLNTAYLLRTGTPQQKAQLIHQVARQYGVDLSQSQEADNTYVDPLLAETRNELNQFKSELQRQKQAQASAEVEAFKNNPKNEHFTTLAPTMGKLIQTGEAKTLEEAYDKAQWLVPDVRNAILSKQEQEKEAKRIADQKAAATAAKKAAGTQLNSKADIKGGSQPASLRESLEKRYEQIQAA